MDMLNNTTSQELDFFKDNFFIIDSENCSSIKSKLYGYAFTENHIFINSEQCNMKLPEDTCGAFINIIKKENTIRVYQDYFGSYGLYLYIKNNYFALSNSFLYLVHYLKSRVYLSTNYEFTKAFISRPQASLSYDESMVNEIKMLPRNCFVTINISTKTLSITEILQKEHYIKINSKEGMDILDNWHSKWNSIFESLAQKDCPIMLKLSGGKDSRVSLSCLLSPQIKSFNKIQFFTTKDNLYTHSDDYEIASKIAKIYSFNLTHSETSDRYRIDPVLNLKASLYAKCGFHREICPTFFWKKKLRFTITGSGGDLRDLWSESAEDFIKANVEATVFHSIDSRNCLCNQLNKTVQILSKKYPEKKLTANDYFYKQGRQRNHNGKAMVESFLGNEVIISPLLDPVLYKLDQQIGRDNDNDLIYEIIFQRFLSPIKDINFDSNRIIKHQTKLTAKEINLQFPVSAPAYPKNIEIFFTPRILPNEARTNDNALDVLKMCFLSDRLKNVIYHELGEEAYIWAKEYYKNSYHPYISAAALLQIFTITEAVKESNFHNEFPNINLPYCYDQKKSVSINYTNDGVMKYIYKFLSAFRLECKNFGGKLNNIKLEDCSDSKAYFETPIWLCDLNGQGFLLQSYCGKLKLKLKPIQNGTLKLTLKGPWLKTQQSKVCPINIDINKFVVKKNDEVIINIDELFTVNSISTKTFEIPCKYDDHLDIYAEWFPFYYNEDEYLELIHTMKLVNINYYYFWIKDD